MTPHYYETYDLGVTELGDYVEIFNSDKDVYGGYNQYNGLPLQACEGYCFNQQYKITIKLASFGAMIFKHVKKEEPALEVEETTEVEETPVVEETVVVETPVVEESVTEANTTTNEKSKK